jgi:hypothetical protein
LEPLFPLVDSSEQRERGNVPFHRSREACCFTAVAFGLKLERFLQPTPTAPKVLGGKPPAGVSRPLHLPFAAPQFPFAALHLPFVTQFPLLGWKKAAIPSPPAQILLFQTRNPAIFPLFVWSS